jgi:hypothetical protein
MVRLKQFCFPSGEAIRQEGGEGDVIHRPRPAVNPPSTFRTRWSIIPAVALLPGVRTC